MKLSIIVPVYNVEKYIKTCLDSIVNQINVGYDNYEVIVVNDGSPDNSLSIINNYEWKGCNHTIISQNNKGLSGARNVGLECAVGDYVWFVDSDDYISTQALSIVTPFLHSVEIINLAYREVRDGREGLVVKPEKGNNGIEVLKRGLMHPAQFHIFKRSFLENNELSFMEGIYHEDTEFTPRCAYLAKSITTIEIPIYYYNIRGGSIMTTLRPKRAFDYLTVAESLICFSNAHGETLKSTPLLDIICLSINNSLYIISQSEIEEQKKWTIRFEEYRHFVDALVYSTVNKYHYEGVLFRILPFSKISIYKFLKRNR